VSRGQDGQTVYAAAQGREFLRGALEGKDNRYIREFAGLIDDPRTLDLLNYYCSLWADKGENFLDTRMAEIVIRNASTRAVDRAYREGNVSQLQGMVGLTSQTEDASDALTEIVERLTHEGTIAVVTGPPGAGKTATTLDVSRAWAARTGGALYGNTGWDGYDEVVNTDRDLLEAMASRKGPALGVLDEASQSLTGRGADSTKAEAFADRMTLIRKSEADHGPHAKRGSLLAVSHNWSRMNAPMRRLATLIIQKPSRKDPGRVKLWRSDGGEDKREDIGTYTGLTDTRENYPEHEASEFDVVLSDDADDADDLDADDLQRETAIGNALRAVKPWTDDAGMSYREAGNVVDYSEGWVSDRVQEWRSGEHRHLVDVNTAEGDSE